MRIISYNLYHLNVDAYQHHNAQKYSLKLSKIMILLSKQPAHIFKFCFIKSMLR